MNELEKKLVQERITRGFAALAEHPSDLHLLRRRLKGCLHTLRQAYAQLGAQGDLQGWQLWLSDNFYLIEGHAKQALGDLRGCLRRSVPLASLYFLLRAVFGDGELPFAEQTAEWALMAANEVQELGERQLGFVYTALKCALIETAADACTQPHEPAERERLIAYAVQGLGALGEIDFAGLGERCSSVEEILSHDPAGVYPRMAAQSKLHYRQAAARIADRRRMTERAVAQQALESAARSDGERTAHVGFYLMRDDPQTAAARTGGRRAFAAIWGIPVVVALMLAVFARAPLLACLSLFPLVEIVRIITIRLVMRRQPPVHLPRMRLGTDAPITVAAIATLLPEPKDAGMLADRLEQLYFSNRGAHLRFVVLADFGEDRRPSNPQDAARLSAAKRAIEALNLRYGERFGLFVRRRVYCATQDRYCGWERKRGAITEFIRFLKGSQSSVCCFVGALSAFTDARYLLTLDSDTGLAFETADTLLSAAIHPLNRPVVGKNQIVTAGYGILVPALGIGLAAAKATPFAQLMAGAGGISSYEQESGDFYQDLFGEAIFCGKGLLDIELFHQLIGRRLPENAVLSHDILEGAFLRVGLVSDVEMTDGTPKSALSWFARLHRWVRGDWQNLRFLGGWYTQGQLRRENPIGLLSRYKLFDNLRRSLVPGFAVLCLLCAGLYGGRGALWLLLLAVGSVALGPLWGAVGALWTGGRFALTRRYFAHSLPRVFELLGQGLLLITMMVQQAVVGCDAAIRAVWRMAISKRGLLQWTTAAQSEGREAGVWAVLRRSWLSELIGLGLLLFSPHLAVKLVGVCALCYLPVAVWTARPSAPEQPALDREERERVRGWCAQMFAFYTDYVNEQNQWLPPDNVQFSPRMQVARRTSPTNIGMYLLSCLVARDLHLLDDSGLYLALERTIDTVERLPKMAGNLYNWYATDDLRVLPDGFVSAVDSGNFLCALVALEQGVLEYAAYAPKLGALCKRMRTLREQTDLSVFYNRRRRLFSIGLNAQGERMGAHYDFLMSEARTLSYYAIATRQVGRRHWRAMSRTMSRNGAYAGPVSWTGTMFEYFMPHLLLPAHEGSLLGEAMQYALLCQKRRARQAGVPWGISESGYYAFDGALNYQYKAHGVQTLGVKQGLDRELVVAPYASFLALPFDPQGAMKNLEQLARMGLEGQYGLFEAADFTPGRVEQDRMAVVRSYMAHHVGMSLIACANALNQNQMQRRFMRDRAMAAAAEFLEERIAKDAVVYDRMRMNDNRQTANPKQAQASEPAISAVSPACTMLANGAMSLFCASDGVSFLRYGDCDVTRRSRDPLLHGQGLLSVVRMNGETVSATEAPFYQSGVARSCTFDGEQATFTAECGSVALTERLSLDETLPVLRCTVTVKNRAATKALAELLFYLEPVLARESEYAAHPAFSKLFVLGGRELSTDTITFHRRHRDCTDGLFLSAGFLEQTDYNFLLRREDLTGYPDGMARLLQFDRVNFSGGTATPDGCLALRANLVIPPRGSRTVELLLSCAPDKAESVGNLLTLREQKRRRASALFAGDSIADRFGTRLLPDLLFAPVREGQSERLAKNTRGRDALFTLGLSGDLPIVLYDWAKTPDPDCLGAYLSIWETMRLHRLEFDLCLLGSAPITPPEGVRVFDPLVCEPSLLAALYAAACHIADGQTELPMAPAFTPAPILSVTPAPIPAAVDRFDLVGGAYLSGQFYVERVTPLPFSHILANPDFGTLVQDAGLGNSWWKNARECRISGWSNDIATGSDGERLLLHHGGQIYDLVRGARACFSPALARWSGQTDGVRTGVSVAVDERESIKTIDVTLGNETDQEVEVICAYLLEPVLGVSRLDAKYTQFAQERGCLLLHNPYTLALSCHAAIGTPGEYPSYTTDRAAFYAGDWSARELLPNNDPIAGILIRKKLPPRRTERIRFILTAAESRERALSLALRAPSDAYSRPARLQIETPDLALNAFFNGMLTHQVRAGRLFGRCAFYQCSGAFGFRDQLQDVAACLLFEPSLARAQILRCCAAQFPEGDVLHWWHPLPDGLHGVRTAFSDDLIWLPLTVAEYLEATGDDHLLDEQVSYCAGEPLAPGEQERYQKTVPDGLREDVYAHCIRALERAHRLGERGLVKIGCGDWNDGFSRIGVQGKGESVWLALFLAMVLDRFAPVCTARGDAPLAERFRAQADALRESVDRQAWDGQWYLRAFFDDGTPVGGAECAECKIDLLAQSFAVLGGMPDHKRVQSALDAAMRELVDERYRLVRLFTPPFDKSSPSPGYIQAYPTGVRENGGQYTHAAVWFAMALLRAGRTAQGVRILRDLNPADRCTDAALARAYKLEPYYMPADIYTHEGAYGHGGWSLYTGAAGWYLRAVSEELLGLSVRRGRLICKPRMPEDWSGFSVRLRREQGELSLTVRRTGTASITVDGKQATEILLDGGNHNVLLTI